MDGEFISASWHSMYPLLVANKSDGALEVIDDSGSKIDSVNVPNSSKPLCLKWHPNRKLLAYGTINGEDIIQIQIIKTNWIVVGAVGVWNTYESQLREGLCHQSKIISLSWEADGTRLICGDCASNMFLISMCILIGRLLRSHTFQFGKMTTGVD